MNIWQKFEYIRNFTLQNKGISIHYEKGIETELRNKFISFAKWLRKNYIFPVHINIYICNCEKIRLINGQMAYGSFRWYPKRAPRIRIAAAVEKHLLDDFSKDEIYEQILSSLVHELTHYYQWFLNLEQSDTASEKQADYYRYRIIRLYEP